jgi:aspartate racemase
MKTIGLLGGMSWESTLPYYRTLNETVRARLGGLHSAKVVLWSVDFAEVEALQHRGDWAAAGALLAEAAGRLQAAGADFLVLATNTMHKVAPAITAAVPGLPLLHIADATAARILAAGHRRIGLLGTRFTMEQDFYTQRLRAHGLEVLVPETDGRAAVHRIIYEELCLGRIEPASRATYQAEITALVARGAEAVILGCTEITLLIGPDHSPVPVFDTTAIHAEAAAHRALEGH